MKHTPIELISDLNGTANGLRGELNRLHSQLGYEMEDVEEQWNALARMGAQRDDHAAELLGKLRPHLEGIASFCSRCVEQINAMKADPFGRKDRP